MTVVDAEIVRSILYTESPLPSTEVIRLAENNGITKQHAHQAIRQLKENGEVISENGELTHVMHADEQTTPNRHVNNLNPAAVTSADVRIILVEQMRNLQNGKATVEESHAVCKIAREIVESAKVDIKYAEMRNEIGFRNADPGRPMVLTAPRESSDD